MRMPWGCTSLGAPCRPTLAGCYQTTCFSCFLVLSTAHVAGVHWCCCCCLQTQRMADLKRREEQERQMQARKQAQVRGAAGGWCWPEGVRIMFCPDSTRCVR